MTRRRGTTFVLTAILALAVLVAIVPFVVALARTPAFDASVAIVPVDHAEVGLPRDPTRTLRSLVDSPNVEFNLVWAAGFLLDPADAARHTTLNRSGETVWLTARAASPARASSLAAALAKLAVGASALEVQNRAIALLAKTRGELERDDVSVRRRTLLRRRERALARLAAAPPEWFAVGLPTIPSLQTSADRAVDRLPGHMPPTPNPLLVLFVGVMVAAAAAGPVVARLRRSN